MILEYKKDYTRINKFVKLNVKNEFNEIICVGENLVTTMNAELWDWRYRYRPTGAREQKRLYYSPHGDSCNYVHPWVYYLLGAGGEQLAVYHGIQTSELNFGTGRRVLMYASQFITNGGELTYNLAGKEGLIKQYQITDYIGNVRVTANHYDIGDSVNYTSYDYKPFGEDLNTSSESEGSRKLGFIGREQDFENN